MRLGLLIFDDEPTGELATLAAALTDTLCAADVDVITPEEDQNEPPPLAANTNEGERLGRADCDGVLFLVGAKAHPARVLEAAFFANCPVLLAGTATNPAFFDAAGALADAGVLFDRLILTNADILPAVHAWLHQNSKKERQRGTEAAQKLYGQRLLVSGELRSGQSVDAAQWLHQFGVFVTYAGGAAEETSAGDFLAPDGDVYGALTVQLLRLVAGKEAEIRTVSVADLPLGEEPATIARLARRAGRFVCLLATGSAFTPDQWADVLLSGHLHIAPGDHLGAVRAACFALDITPVGLR